MKVALFAIAYTLGAAYVGGAGVNYYKTLEHGREIIAAKVEAYTEGRAQAIDDMSGPNGVTSAPTAELCTAWWFGTNDKASAIALACKTHHASKSTKLTNHKTK